MAKFEEEKRLGNLASYGLNNNDSPKESLKPIIALASKICKTSVSLVDIIDEFNQQTIVTHGDWDEVTIPRENSICDRTVVDGKLLVLDDVKDNPEIWKRLPEEDKKKIRFYAGAPLTSPEGYILGALCVIDSEPRSLSTFQKESLQTLADEVVTRLHLYKQTNELQEKNKRLEKFSTFLENSADLLCIIDPETHKILDINDDCLEELGYSKESLIGNNFMNYVDSDSSIRHDIKKWFNKADENNRHSLPVRLKNSRNKEKWYRCSFTQEKNKWYLTARNITNQKTAEDRIKSLRDKYEKITKASSDIIFEYDFKSDGITWVNGLQVLGYSKTEKYVDFKWWAERIHPDDKENVINNFLKISKSAKNNWKTTYRFRANDGSYKYIMGNAHIDRDENGKPATIFGALADMSELRKSEIHQKSLVARLNQAHHMAELGYWEINLKDGSVFWSDDIYFILNTNKKETTPSIDYIINRVEPDDKIRITKLIDKLSLEEGIGEVEHKIKLTDTEYKYLYHRGELKFENGEPAKVIITTQDITDRKEKELKISQSLKEKETLLAEIHHRVKNNLAIVSGLLEMNAFTSSDESKESFIRSSQLRIKSMAKIHEKLYESDSFTHISFKEYIIDLLDTIKSSVQTNGLDVAIETQIQELDLNINYAIPCGLILNELISNSFEHAFEGRETGEIQVELSKEGGLIELVFHDNGIGLPDNFDIKKCETLGMTLVNILCKQIGANLDFDTSYNGFKCKIGFEQKGEVKGSSSSFM